MQAIGADKEFTETRKQAGAVIESGVMTPISDEFFTNHPDAFMQHWIVSAKQNVPLASLIASTKR